MSAKQSRRKPRQIGLDFAYWRQFAILPVWKIAALLRGVDPRDLPYITEPVDETDTVGIGLDLSEEKQILTLAIRTGALPTIHPAPETVDGQTEIKTADLVVWLKSIGRGDLAAGLAPIENIRPLPTTEAATQLTENQTDGDAASRAADNEIAGARRRALDDNTYKRGCPRLILENWDDIQQQHGLHPNAHQVLRVLKKNLTPTEKAPTLKSVQNRLIDLRKEKYIP